MMRGVSADLERAIEFATDVRGELVGTGHSFSMIYLDAAIRSMRHARAALLRAAMAELPGTSAEDSWRRMVFADGMPTPVHLRADPAEEVWIRGSAGVDGVEPCEGVECEWRRPIAIDLGADLLASPLARELAGGVAGASLLMDALAYQTWFRPDHATRWTAGVASARSIVTALSGGAAVSALAPAIAGRFVDRQVLLMIEELGWRRDPAARWRVRADDGGPAPATACRV